MDRIVNYKVISNTKINSSTYMIELKGPTEWIQSGKFLNIQVPNKYLKRPMSVYDWNKSSLKVLYKLIGKGTKILSTIEPNQSLEILTDLGNTYTPSKNKKQLIVCGGCGMGSVYKLAKQLSSQHIDVTIIVGFKTKADVFVLNDWKKVCKNLIITTDDGSVGFKGTVVDAINKYKLNNLYYYTCGSINLMKAVYKCMKSEGQLSLEARMGCGFGACMGCTIETKHGPKRICADGPIFNSKELLW